MITASDLIVPSTFSDDKMAPFFGFLGTVAALVFSCMGAVYGTPKRGVGVASIGVMRFELLMTSKSGDEVDLRFDYLCGSCLLRCLHDQLFGDDDIGVGWNVGFNELIPMEEIL
ncbi:hypothetical protein Tco_0898351 [Tanacetum coccineum]